MKLKRFENWVSDATDKNVSFNYGDKKPKLSDDAIDTIKFIEDNFDNISTEVLNNTTKTSVVFNGNLKYYKIRLGFDDTNKIPHIHFYYYGSEGVSDYRGYKVDITDYDYEYLSDYFYKIYKIFKKKDEEKQKILHASELDKIEDKKMKNAANKYNIG